MRLLTTILFLTAGCVGSIGDEDPGDGNPDPNPTDGRAARVIFKADVHPAMGKCSGGVCHDINATSGAIGKFYDVNADTAYDATVIAPTMVNTFESIAPILTHVQAGHKGLSYTPDETGKITAWLAAETKERAKAGPNTPPPFDAKGALKEWSGCMSLENFTAANMTTAWAQLGADNLQKCLNCHNGGVAGFLIINNAQQFFTQLTASSAYLLKYFTVDTVARKVIVNVGSFQAATKIAGHPTFNATTNAGMTALLKLYESTLARKAANLCDPPRLVD
jgi:hypothetical protein